MGKHLEQLIYLPSDLRLLAMEFDRRFCQSAYK
jgi:hypothetical protein